MVVQTFEGRGVTIRFDSRRCIHARRCVTGEPGVFKSGVSGDWVDPDAAPVEDVMRIAYACPSGAITAERKDKGTNEHPPRVNIVMVRENGPLAFHADMTIEGHGKALRATLCRCGLSANKPFCDNAHVAGGFVATGEPEARDSDLQLSDLTGEVVVKPVLNGPLMVTGRLEVETGSGRAVERVEKAWFCRCGHSSKKPFCDGTHKRIGFKAP